MLPGRNFTVTYLSVYPYLLLEHPFIEYEESANRRFIVSGKYSLNEFSIHELL